MYLIIENKNMCKQEIKSPCLKVDFRLTQRFNFEKKMFLKKKNLTIFNNLSQHEINIVLLLLNLRP